MELIAAFWQTLVMVAPYLLLGFLLAGIISQLMPVAWVRRHLGARGPWASVKAALFGIPLPICSCGVIPLAASLRDRGASKAATLSFLVATPQTSVDSIILCFVLVGPVFAVFSPATALIAALVAGGLFALLRRREPAPAMTGREEDACEQVPAMATRARRALAYGFGKMPDDIGREILIGLAVAALIAVYLPVGVLGDYLGNGLFGKLAMVAAAVPVYVCSTSSVPVVAALIAKGVSPGTAFVFYIAGSATNAATVATVAKVLGGRAVTAYLFGVTGVAIGAGMLMDIFFLDAFAGLTLDGHHHEELTWLWHLAGVALLGVLLWPSLRKLQRRLAGGHNARACCDSEAPTKPASSCCGGGSPSAPNDSMHASCADAESSEATSSCCK